MIILKKSNNVIVKISIIVSAVLLLFSVIIFPIVCTLFEIDFESVEKLWIALLLFTVVSSIIMVLLLSHFGIDKKKIEPYKSFVTFKDFNSFVHLLEISLKHYNYHSFSITSVSNGKLNMFCKPICRGILHSFVVIKVDELDEDILLKFNNAITKHFDEKYGKKRTIAINLISLFCVNRITPTFRELTENQPIQGWKNGRFIAGLSFGSKKLYIAQQKGGFGFLNYNKLKKEFNNVFQYAQQLNNKL